MRQNIDHIDRFLWVCRPENIARFAADLERLSGAKMHGPWLDEAQGAHICASNSAGLQIMAPVLGSSAPMARRLIATLNARGEGAFGVWFGVPDIAVAHARMRALGLEPGELIRAGGGEPWVAEIGSMVATVACEVMNTYFIFAEIAYPDGVLSLDGSEPGMTRNNDRVDHIAWLCHPENVGRNVALMSALGGTPLDGPYDIVPLGIRVSLSWETGLEVIAPIPGSTASEAVATNALLSQYGEGMYAVLFGVSDLDASLDRARADGRTPGRLIVGGSNPEVPWAGKYCNFREIGVGDVINTPFMFCTTDYPEGIFRTRKQA